MDKMDELIDKIDRQAEFLRALAETVLEVSADGFTVDSLLDPWDSLAWIATIALIDETFNKQVPGADLALCKTAGDVLRLVA